MSKTILFLYSELMPYNLPWFSILTQQYGYKVIVVHWDTRKQTPYLPPTIPDVAFHLRSNFSTIQLQQLADNLQPDIIYSSGRMDSGYLRVCSHWKSKGSITVCGFDTPWQSTWRQWIAVLGRSLFFKPYFTHIWVPGRFQYEYARKLGFAPNQILMNLYAANTIPFRAKASAKLASYPHRILFVGRLTPEKGIQQLTKAFSELQSISPNDWILTVVGDGSLKSSLPIHPSIEYIPFSSQVQLAQLASQSGIFCLPSPLEHWGVVVHELAAAGLPLLLSEQCGAASEFLINGFNGYFFKGGNIFDLQKKLLLMMSLPDTQLSEMGKNSQKLSERISAETSVASLVSILNC
ncbi:MAG: glycosyltransferase [Spirosomataceae bacterium]